MFFFLENFCLFFIIVLQQKNSIIGSGNNENNNIVEDLQKQVRLKTTEHEDACKTVKKLLLGMESLQRELKRLKENEVKKLLKL